MVMLESDAMGSSDFYTHEDHPRKTLDFRTTRTSCMLRNKALHDGLILS